MRHWARVLPGIQRGLTDKAEAAKQSPDTADAADAVRRDMPPR